MTTTPTRYVFSLRIEQSYYERIRINLNCLEESNFFVKLVFSANVSDESIPC